MLYDLKSKLLHFMPTVQTLIIGVYNVCQCPFYGMLGLIFYAVVDLFMFYTIDTKGVQ